MTAAASFDLTGRVALVTGGDRGKITKLGILVNAIAPGWIGTDMTAMIRTEAFKAMNDEILLRTPAGRWGRPDEMAGMAIFLASSAADFVTGETTRVDGGHAIRWAYIRVNQFCINVLLGLFEELQLSFFINNSGVRVRPMRLLY